MDRMKDNILLVFMFFPFLSYDCDLYRSSQSFLKTLPFNHYRQPQISYTRTPFSFLDTVHYIISERDDRKFNLGLKCQIYNLKCR